MMKTASMFDFFFQALVKGFIIYIVKFIKHRKFFKKGWVLYIHYPALSKSNILFTFPFNFLLFLLFLIIIF